MKGRVKRQYHSSARAAAAAETAGRITRAARDLFVARGYAATTLRDVAERAGVGERTLYDAFGGKSRLLVHTIGQLSMGDADSTPVARRPEVAGLRDLADPRDAVAATIAYNTALLERAGDLILVAEEGARADPTLQGVVRAGVGAAYDMFRALADRLQARGELGPGLDASMAADVMWALASPEVFALFRRRRRWSAPRYRDWLVDAVHAQVLPTDGQPKAEGKPSR